MYKSKTNEEILLDHHDKLEKNRELSEASFKILNDKISAQSIQDINSAISNYFNGPDATKNMQGLLSRIDNIRVSNGQKPIFK